MASKTLNHQRTPSYYRKSVIQTWACHILCYNPKLWRMPRWYQSVCSVEDDKPTQSFLYALLQVTPCRKLSHCSFKAFPYCLSERPGPFSKAHSSQAPHPSSAYSITRSLSKSDDSLIPCSCMSLAIIQLTCLHSFSPLSCPWHHFPYSHFPTVDFGHINLHSVLLSSGLTTLKVKDTFCLRAFALVVPPRMFFLQISEHDRLSFEILHK